MARIIRGEYEYEYEDEDEDEDEDDDVRRTCWQKDANVEHC
jgi:hypothetical protein